MFHLTDQDFEAHVSGFVELAEPDIVAVRAVAEVEDALVCAAIEIVEADRRLGGEGAIDVGIVHRHLTASAVGAVMAGHVVDRIGAILAFERDGFDVFQQRDRAAFGCQREGRGHGPHATHIGHVMGRADLDRVVGKASGHDSGIVSGAAVENVVAAASGQPVVSAAAAQLVVAVSAGDVVITGPADDILEIPHDIGVRLARGACRPRRQIDAPVAGRARGGIEAERVVARAAVERVVPGARIDRVVAGAGIDRIVAAERVDHVVASRAGDRVVAIRRAEIVGDFEIAHHAAQIAVGRPVGGADEILGALDIDRHGALALDEQSVVLEELHKAGLVDRDLPGCCIAFHDRARGGDVEGLAVLDDLEAHVRAGPDLSEPDLVLAGAIAEIEDALEAPGVDIVVARFDRQLEGTVDLLVVDIIDRIVGFERAGVDQRHHVDAQETGLGGHPRLVDGRQHPHARHRSALRRQLNLDRLIVDDLEAQLFEADVGIARMGHGARAQHRDHGDIRGVVDLDLEAVTRRDILRRRGDFGPFGEIAVLVEEIGRREDLGVEIGEGARRAATAREDRAVRQHQRGGVIKAGERRIGLIDDGIVVRIPDRDVLLGIFKDIALVIGAATADDGDPSVGERHETGIGAGAVELGDLFDLRFRSGDVDGPETAIVVRQHDLVLPIHDR